MKDIAWDNVWQAIKPEWIDMLEEDWVNGNRAQVVQDIVGLQPTERAVLATAAFYQQVLAVRHEDEMDYFEQLVVVSWDRHLANFAREQLEFPRDEILS